MCNAFEKVNVLIVGCGGLGNEVIKNLIYMNIKNMSIIDYDTIEVSNLHRQLFFTNKDIGEYKVDVISKRINEKYKDIFIHSYKKNIEFFDAPFFEKFDFIIGCLDNISSRLYINNLIFNLKKKEIIYIDGGVEGFKGSIKIVNTRNNFACLQCTVENYANVNTTAMATITTATSTITTAINSNNSNNSNSYSYSSNNIKDTFPVCSIINKPKTPEDCILYVMNISFEKIKKEKFDVNNENHIIWVFEEAKKRARHFHIDDVSYSLTEQVVRNSIPTIVSTIMVIASLITSKLYYFVLMSEMGSSNSLGSIHSYTHNYSDILYVGDRGFYLYYYKIYKNPHCVMCNKKRVYFTFKKTDTLNKLVQLIREKYNSDKINISSDSSILFLTSKYISGKTYEQKLNSTFQQLIDKGEITQRGCLNIQTEKFNFLLFLDFK
ncbi:NEDD8-activating enzyme E1 catalytic subunit, putative [Plasmodium malariae]|uniref:NEDD8-activating enzyme E1 catalytic subunit n=1 Tax=Plasmodium malariae TaxID=5858 RepID=A0A1D3JLM4_PLAMA|nr:NEDD8-activating enzyme E1 catalytic subunit, putative [Plasmodium malariae]SBT87456.1 NEDD8-activating enzyme E1 catalytic subunit, putative [Plasmodium malariae]